jgi:hypothetical protein
MLMPCTLIGSDNTHNAYAMYITTHTMLMPCTLIIGSDNTHNAYAMYINNRKWQHTQCLCHVRGLTQHMQPGCWWKITKRVVKYSSAENSTGELVNNFSRLIRSMSSSSTTVWQGNYVCIFLQQHYIICITLLNTCWFINNQVLRPMGYWPSTLWCGDIPFAAFLQLALDSNLCSAYHNPMIWLLI